MHDTTCGEAPAPFKQRMLMLHQIGNDLALVESFDELCRQAVIQGRRLLECRRISLWFREGETDRMTGSFGIDESGQIRDERARTMSVGKKSPMGRVLDNRARVLINKDSKLYNDMGAMIGHGELVVAALWNGRQVIGCVCTDNLLDQQPFAETDVDLLDMLASTIGHLAFRKRAEDDLKKLLREKELLLMEVNHRVKNNLQVISSLLSLQSAHVRDPLDLEMFRQSQSRVKSIAMVYEAFATAHDLTCVKVRDYMAGIVREIVNLYAGYAGGVTVRWAGDDAALPLAQAIPCGLIVNELVTNAFKHGFSGDRPHGAGDAGAILITVSGAARSVTIAVENNGRPFPADIDVRNPSSLGLRIVHILVGQLRGRLDWELNGRTKAAVTFPRPD